MAMQVGPGAGGGGRRRRRRGRNRRGLIGEINVTPFVDVMLVLLIIFMVAAPMMTSGVPIDLPKTSAKALAGDNKPITVSISSDGKIYIQNSEIAMEDVVPKLKAIAGNAGTDRKIYIRGDKSAGYGIMMQVMGRINAAGFTKLGLVTLEDQGS